MAEHALTSAKQYEEATGRRNLLAHILADAFIKNKDFEAAAALRDEMTAATESFKKKKEEDRRTL